MREHRAEIDAIARPRRAADLRQHRRRASTAPAACSARVDGAVLQPDARARPRRRCRRCEREHGAAAGGARQRGLHARGAVRAHRRAARRGATRSASTPSSARLLERFHLDFVRAGARARRRRRRRAMREVMRAAGRADDALRAERARRRERLPAACCASEADLAGLPEFVRAAARQAARERGIAGAA